MDTSAHMTYDFVAALVGCWASWAPALSPDGAAVAYLSDRRGHPELWVQPVTDVAGPDAGPARVLTLSEDPVVGVRWSADGQWVSVAVAVGGGVRTQVWIVRPDGSDAQIVAGGPSQHATLGPWVRSGRRFVVSMPPSDADGVSRCELVDPDTGASEPVARGGLVHVLDVSADERFLLLRDGTRGAHFCVTLDRRLDSDHPLLPYPGTGSTDFGLLRPLPRSARPALAADAEAVDLAELTADSAHADDAHNASACVAYLITDAGRPRAALAAVSVHSDGTRGEVGILAERRDAELELIDADDAGTVLALVWNVDGRSEIELLDTATGRRQPVPDLPGEVVSSCVLARDGRGLVVTVEGSLSPRRLWHLDRAGLRWTPITEAPAVPPGLLAPELHRFLAADGLPLTGWLYRVAGAPPGPVVLAFHGGPEAQERPVFSPNHQGLAAAGFTVFAPNVRGSTGFGRTFAHADDRYGRYAGIEDVRSCVSYLVDAGIADPARVAVTGRSYGGYLTLAALVRYPELFAAGVDICGMSDLLTFYRDTEPWIADAAITKYGDPRHDRALLEDLSPLRSAACIDAPLLVVHGELDTNVPINEARQIVTALRALDRPVEYLELAGEGHEYRSHAARAQLLSTVTSFLTAALASPGSTSRLAEVC